MYDSTFRQASQITLAYVAAFFFTIIMQARLKFKALSEHKLQKAQGSKAVFNRYTDPTMLAADRSVGNFIEWQGPFLVLFWLNAYVSGQYVQLGWVYVAARVLYPILAANGGIGTHGPKPLIFVATLPGYAVLIFYFYTIYTTL